MCQERGMMRPHGCVLLREDESLEMNIGRVGNEEKKERQRLREGQPNEREEMDGGAAR